MGTIQAAGTAGYFIGVIVGAVQFTDVTEGSLEDYQRTFVGCVIGYVILNVLGVAGLLHGRRRERVR